MVRRRGSLQVTLLERFAVPEAVGLVDRHVVHVDRDPDVARRHGNLVIDGRVDDEVPGLDVAVFQEIDAGLLQGGEIELGVVVLVELAPDFHGTGEGLLRGTVGSDLPDGSLGLHLVFLVQFDDGNLGLVGDIAHLGEAHVRLADPARDGVRFHGPGDDLAGLAGRQDGPEDVPAVLGEHPAVVELDFAVAGDLHHALRVVRRKEELVAGGKRQGLDELAGAPVVIRPVPLELAHLLRVGPHLRVAHRVARETVGLAVHQIGLVPVLRGQEFQVEARFACQCLRNRFVQIDGDFHRLALGLDDDAGIEVVPVVAHAHLDGLGKRVDSPGCHRGHEVPLLGSGAQADGAALDGAHLVVDYLDAGVLLVIESTAERIVEHEDIDTLSLEITQVIQFQVRSFALACRHEQHGGK